jgi:hypothetical protein
MGSGSAVVLGNVGRKAENEVRGRIWDFREILRNWLEDQSRSGGELKMGLWISSPVAQADLGHLLAEAALL